MGIKNEIKKAFKDKHNAGISNTNCICKNRSPIDKYTLIPKDLYISLLEGAILLTNEMCNQTAKETK